MVEKNKTQVLIGGKIYTLSGFESEDYLQRVAAYLNTKITEVKGMDNYQRLTQDMRALLVTLNAVDDYFKLKKQADELSAQLAEKEKEIYEVKRDLAAAQMKNQSDENMIQALEKEDKKSQQKIVTLETQLKAAEEGKWQPAPAGQGGKESQSSPAERGDAEAVTGTAEKPDTRRQPGPAEKPDTRRQPGPDAQLRL